MTQFDLIVIGEAFPTPAPFGKPKQKKLVARDLPAPSLPSMSIMKTIAAWRALPEHRRQEIRWRNIPAQVADSMAFERDPVNRTWIKAQHLRATPPAASKLRKAS
jgi:hypothetical protein